MATNTSKKRDIVKYVRDGIKSNYTKQDCCERCGSEKDLELHHYNSVKLIVDKFIQDNNLPEPETEAECMQIREDIYKEFWHELVEDTVTLCSTDHKALHKIYGVVPPLRTAQAQRNWVANAVLDTPSSGRFSRFKVEVL